MKVPLKWLKDYVNITLPVKDLAQKLTLAGFEVAEIINTGGSWENVLVGQIKSINPHPNADRLRLATVDLGTEQETVVCGAPNLNIGDKIAFARTGARLINPSNGQVEELKPAKIRGVVSRGMVCSEKELGISESHDGILVLPSEAEVGKLLAEQIGDIVLDLDITPNRPDCLSVIGIAREAAALCGKKMQIPERNYPETGEPIGKKISIEIEAPDLCPRYSASLITGIEIGPSPAWLQERLTACGQRPINNIVDITNYIMMEYGQPLHSFDYDRIKGKKIIVRRATEGEPFYTLDETERKLNHEMLVIGDGERTVAIAGVMGGLNSEVTDSTTSILLEAASFKATCIHATGRQLELTSEASMRFERGISAEMTLPALRHATQLIAELGGGEVAQGIIDMYPGKKEPVVIKLTPARVERSIGLTYSREQIINTLESLGFTCTTERMEITVTAPYWRSDIKQGVDIIEEVARVVGYDKIPTTLLSVPIPPQNPEPVIGLKKRTRQILAGFGFQEIMSYTMNGTEMTDKLVTTNDSVIPRVKINNPMTADQEYMRTTLRGGLLTALVTNRRHEEGGIRLFEIGKIYLPRQNTLPAEPEILVGLISGPRVEKSWLGCDGNFDFYDAKGIVEGLLERRGRTIRFEKSSDTGLHPSRQAAIIVEESGLKTTPGVIGELHPVIGSRFELTETVCLFEINLTALAPFMVNDGRYQSIPRFPSISRDIALVVDTGVTHGQIMDIIKSYPLITEVKLFDVYSGKQVATGKKSLAYRLVYQLSDKTLTDEQVNRVQEKLLARLEKELGATLRG